MKAPNVILILLGSAGVSFAGPETHEHKHHHGDEQHRHHEAPPVVHVPPVTNVPRALPPPVGQTFSRPESTFGRPSSTFFRPAPPAIGVAPGVATQTERRHDEDFKQPGEKPHDGHHHGRGPKERHPRHHTHHVITYYPFDPYYYLYDQQLQEPPQTDAPAQEAAPVEEKPETAPPVVIDLPPGARIIRPAASPESQSPAAKTAPGE